MKILLADDHALIREGFERTLIALDNDPHFVHANDRASVLTQLREHLDLDVILLDLFMPGVNGFDLLSEICNQYSHIPVIVISGTEDPRYMRKSIDKGASGFIPKSEDPEIMISAIKLVQNGGVYIPSDMLKKKNADADSYDKSISEQVRNNEIHEAAVNLTERQHEVLKLMACGMSNKEIARVLDLSNHTVKVHVGAILKILKVSNRTEAVVITKNAGIIQA